MAIPLAPPNHVMTRRAALGQLAALLAAAAFPGVLRAAAEPTAAPLPTVTFGRAGVTATRLGVQLVHMAYRPAAEMRRTLAAALELGINYFDTASFYGRRGEGETRLGEFVDEVGRDRLILGTKSQARTAEQFESDLARSLQRLRTPHIDIWQFHLVASAREVDRMIAPGGVLDAARRAVADGRIRVLGAMGVSSPDALLALMEAAPAIEAIQCPVNVVDPHWKSFVRTVVPTAVRRGVAVLASHDLAMGQLRAAYRLTVEEARRYTLSQPITAWLPQIESIEDLKTCVAALRTHTPLTPTEETDLLTRSRLYSGPAFEFYKMWD